MSDHDDDGASLVSESTLDPEDDVDMVDAPPPRASPPPPSPPAAAPAVESLVAGRQRRANAGNRLQTLLNQEADKEDTLFLEDEDDVEFQVKDKDDFEDYLVESSESEDDDAAAGKDDEDAGEKEIQAAEKEEKRARKRRAKEALMKPTRGITTAAKKPVAVAQETETAEVQEEYNALTRPRKKSERVSWVPDFTATRASTRGLSLKNRSDTMRKLEEAEKRRLNTIKLMEKAAAKKNKNNPKREMTQEERLAEAKITEEKNLKSLNRWEEEEKARLEEQRRKLAALQNRRLEGPVITFWSGRAEWNPKNGKLMRVGKGVQEVEEIGDVVEVRRPRSRSKKADDEQNAHDNAHPEAPTPQVNGAGEKPAVHEESQKSPPHTRRATPPAELPFTPPPYLHPDNAPPPGAPATQNGVGMPTYPNGVQDHATLPDPTKHPTGIAPPAAGPAHAPAATPAPPPIVQPTQPAAEASLPAPVPAPPVPAAEPEPEPEVSTRNLVLLEDFSPELVGTAQDVMRVFFPAEGHHQTWPTAKPLCLITRTPARFRDPRTGMPYADLAAYRELKRVLRGEIRWAPLLGAYIGEDAPAQGVPEGF